MKKIIRPLLILVVYVLGIVVGALTVSAYPLARQKEFTIAKTQRLARYVSDGTVKSCEPWMDGVMRILIYDVDGTVLWDASADGSPSPIVHHEEFLPDVLNGEIFFQYRFADNLTNRLHSLMGVCGAPVKDGGETVGAVFFIRKTIAITESLFGYLVYFTVFFWSSVILITTYIRKRKKLDEMQRSYIANVTHALKTPISSIMALSETLCDDVEEDPDKQKVYYGIILQEASGLNHMTCDILELSRIQNSGMDFSKSAVAASEIFDPIEEKYCSLCGYMGITVHISESVRALPMLYTNAECVRQTLSILMDNAIKFIGDGGDIWLDASVYGKTVTISVRDNGVGIESDVLPHIFERFYKVSSEMNTSGSGLGLTIAHEMALALKERIWAESKPGEGASFFFTTRIK